MATNQAQKQSILSKKFAESILVVKRETLFAHETWQGIKAVDMTSYQQLIAEHQEFHPRGLMEQDPQFKQIIPYLVFMHEDTIFVMQRDAQASEERLQSNFSIGIGGHIRKEDMDGTTIFDWARREFHEEVQYTGSFDITPIGLLNDDSNAVGQVHLGLVLLLQGNSPDIQIKSELQSGNLMTLPETQKKYEAMENWSKLALDYLKQKLPIMQ